MHFTYTPVMLPLVLAAVVSAWVAVYAWRRRQTTGGAIALSLLGFAVAEWILAYIFELGSADLPAKVLWAKCEYLGIAAVPVLWLIFNLGYARQGRNLPGWQVALMAIIPLITMGMAATTEWHGLIWQSYRVQSYGAFSALAVTHGLWFWVHSAYSYLALLGGTVVLLFHLRRVPGLYRGQVAVLLLGVVSPWVSNFLYLSGLFPIVGLDPTPFAFAITSAALAWGIFGFRLIDLAPLARDLVVDEMHDAMLVLDTSEKVADLNPAAQRILGKAADQMVGRPAVEALGQHAGTLLQLKDQGDASAEISLGAGEAQRWYELRQAGLFGKNRRPLGHTLLLRDITDQRRAREQLRHQNEYLSILHQITLELLDRRSLDDLLQAITRQACRLLDAPYSNLLVRDGEKLRVRVTTDELPFPTGAQLTQADAPFSWQVLASHQPAVLEDYSNWEGRSRQIDGLQLHAAAQFPVVAGETSVGVLSVWRTRPDYPFQHDQIQTGSLFAQLAALVLDNAGLYDAALKEIAERKRAEAELAVARDQALEASQFKSQLLAKVSHELRTPLSAILGYAELLYTRAFGPVSEQQAMAAQSIVASAQYLNIMIGELLDQSQIESKTLRLTQRRYSPAAVVKEAASNLRVLAESKGLAFTTSIAMDLPAELYGDERRVLQILINLLSNAIKFTRQGGVALSIFLPNPEQWEILVSDTGAGIPEDALEYIFEPFRQVDNTITHENRGTGLGLSITKQLVEMMGGVIHVQSQVGLGSTFSVLLPLTLAPDGRNEPAGKEVL